MTTLKDALERAGFASHEISFLSACRDQAILSLNQTRDNPTTAVQVWLNGASGRLFRSGPLLDYLKAIAVARTSAVSRQQAPIRAETTYAVSKDHTVSVQRDALEDGTIRAVSKDHTNSVPPQEPPIPEGSTRHRLSKDQSSHVTPREPTALHRKVALEIAKTHAKVLLDGFMITDRQGARGPLAQVRLASIKGLLGALEERFFVTSAEYGLLRQIDAWVQRLAEVQPHVLESELTVGDVLDDAKFVEFRDKAVEFSASRTSALIPDRARQQVIVSTVLPTAGS